MTAYSRLGWRWRAVIPHIIAVLCAVAVIGVVSAMVWTRIIHPRLVSILPGYVTVSTCLGIDLEAVCKDA